MTRYARLIRHPLAISGVIIATTAGIEFVVLVIALVAGLFDNPYAGLIIAVAVPAVLVVGLVLVPIGMWLEHRRRRHDPRDAGWPVLDFRHANVRRATLVVVAFCGLNLVIVPLAGYSGVRWMESPGFCGQVCHTAMQPQFTAWQHAPHATVACVKCHIGEGGAAFLHAKLAGLRQLRHVATDSYARPTPPGAEMPPGAQAATCRGCHTPERAVGDRIRVVRSYADDETNTATTTVLQMYLGASVVAPRAIHWHADPKVRVEYVSTDAANETIPYVKVTEASGRVREYVTAGATEPSIRNGTRRTMDCIDCHNTVGHPIAPTVEHAVDQAIANGLVSRDLPHARREAVRTLKASAGSADEAVSAIARDFRGFYGSRDGPIDEQAVTRTVAALQSLYRRNVFPAMKVKWGTYPDNRGHVTSTGCFRCHDDSHADKTGAVISADCEYCHKQVEATS